MKKICYMIVCDKCHRYMDDWIINDNEDEEKIILKEEGWTKPIANKDYHLCFGCNRETMLEGLSKNG